MDKMENEKRTKLLLSVALVAVMVLLGWMIWSTFFNKPTEETGGVDTEHGVGEEISYDRMLYKNAAILEEEIDLALVGIIETQLELALINNSDLNSKQMKSYDLTLSAPSPATNSADGKSFFYDFDFSLSGTEKGDIKYDVHVMIEGNEDFEIEANYFVTTALKAQGNGYGNFVVTNSPHEEKVQAWAKKYVGDDAKMIQSELYF